MTQKNLDKLERKQRRLPPIPYTRMTPTKQEKQNKAIHKYKNNYIKEI